MTRSRDVDDYLAGIDEPKRSTLEQVRSTLRELLPDAEECISYQMPGFRVDGKMIAGYAAFKNHLSYFPHSGSVIEAVPEASAYGGTKGSLHFPIDAPLPRDLLAKLVEVRLMQAGR